MKVSNSRINLFRNCHYAHYLKYYMDLEKRVKADAFERGSVMHSCIEAYNLGKSWKKPLEAFKKKFYDETFQEERVELGDLPKLVEELMNNYFHYYEDEPYEYIQNELHFELEIMPGVELEGYIDGVVKDLNTGKVWGMETKTYKRLPEREFLMFNNQSAIYIWAMMELGFKVEGMLWNIIRAKEPSKPYITAKKGELSKAALDSTPLTVRKGLKALGLNPKDHEDWINSFGYDGFFYREPIRLNKHVVNGLMNDTISTVKLIVKDGEYLRDRNLGRNCSWCSFKSICQAELMGLDTSYIIKAGYVPRKEGGRKNEKEKDKSKGIRKEKRNRR